VVGFVGEVKRGLRERTGRGRSGLTHAGTRRGAKDGVARGHGRVASAGARGALTLCRFPVYDIYVIRSFRDAETEKIWRQEFSKRFRGIEKPALRKLVQIARAATLRDLALPGNNMEKLEGDRKGQYSIRINDQYRVCFAWQEGDALSVEITDYH